MNDAGRPPWLGTAILAGALYVAAGMSSAALARAAGTGRMEFFWRLSAFVASVVVLAAHVGYEHFRLRRTMRPTVWHATVGGAFGGFGLALLANIHDLGSASGYRPKMLIALAAWPLLTAVPACVVAMVVAAGLGRLRVRASR